MGGEGGVSRSEGKESEVFPLVVVRVLVLQVSYCLLRACVAYVLQKALTRRAALQDGKRLAVIQVGSSFRLYQVWLRGVN